MPLIVPLKTNVRHINSNQPGDVSIFRLAVYIQRVRSFGADGNDSQAFLDALRSIENEANRLKCMYEKELEALRFVFLALFVYISSLYTKFNINP